jgi:hypothetical protein
MRIPTVIRLGISDGNTAPRDEDSAVAHAKGDAADSSGETDPRELDEVVASIWKPPFLRRGRL